ncbi:MAG: glutamate synthase subunit beta [Candidatus Omnitrophota bacterium]
MGNPNGFLKVKRDTFAYRPVCERLKDYREVTAIPGAAHSEDQASRCMDCGTPFCHWACPIGNYIPEWNDLVFHKQWAKAFELLRATNNFPEITGRLCPALCEYSCVLGINDDPVTIRENELAIIENAFKRGIIKPVPPGRRSGKRVAVIGSGPAGLAAADQLNRAGHSVTVFERDDKAGGILRYGIPDFKLEKRIIDRRLNILEREGVEFVIRTEAGCDIKTTALIKDFDALCLAGGSRVPRDLRIEGRDLKGIHFAMEYLMQANRRASGETISADRLIDARDKRVVVIGGGDTGADCVGTAHRQGARCVVQLEVMPKPPSGRTDSQPWPRYPLILKTSTSHEEGGERHWSVSTKRFEGKGGHVSKIACVRLEAVMTGKGAAPEMREMAGSDFYIDADLVILAIGFVHPERSGLLDSLGIDLDGRGQVKTDGRFMTSMKGVFASGDMRRGQSLIVWAISEGRQAAHYIDLYLMGKTVLPKF